MIDQVRSNVASLSRALVMEALALGNGLVLNGKVGPKVKMPKSFRHAHKGFKAGLGAAKKVLKGTRSPVSAPLAMKALPGLEPTHH